nr:organic cation transporter protein-like [Procambarus clarkii]
MTTENGEGDFDKTKTDATEMEEGTKGKEVKNKVTSSYGVDDLSWVTTFEHLLQVVGESGRWNVLIFIMCSAVAFVSPLQTLSYQFLGATPDHWCHVAPLVEANWTQNQILELAIPFSNATGKREGCQMRDLDYKAAAALGYEATMQDVGQVGANSSSALIFCPVREFNHSQYASTVVTEWDLVCDRRVLYSTTQAVMQGGKLAGFIIFGYLVDAIGRRPVVLVSVVLYLTAGLLAAAAPSIELYIALKFLVAAVGAGQYLSIFVFVMETCASKYRAASGTLVVVPWALGYMVAPGIAYFIRPWRLLQVTYSAMGFYLIIYFWLLPESPRWLIDQGRYQEALKVLTWMGTVNKKTLPSDEVLLSAMENVNQKKDQQKEESESTAKTGLLSLILVTMKKLVILILTPECRRMTLVVFFCWFSASMVYYGIALNANNLSTDPYLYIFLGGLLEVPSYLLLWPALIYIGRKKTLSALYFFCSVCIFTVMILMVTYRGEAEVAMVIFSQCGKVAVTAGFQLVWMYTAELFPTKYRSLAVGQSSFCARLGSTASPFINDILGVYSEWAPSALFGAVSLISASLALLLPETKSCDLPESNGFFSAKNGAAAAAAAGAAGGGEAAHKQDEKGVTNLSFIPGLEDAQERADSPREK